MVTPTTGNSFDITSPDWFKHQGLKNGDTLELGYQMTYDGDQEPRVVSVEFNGNNLCSDSGSSGTTTTTITGSTSSQNSGVFSLRKHIICFSIY